MKKLLVALMIVLIPVAGMTEEIVKSALSKVMYPGFTKDIVTFGFVNNIEITGNKLILKGNAKLIFSENETIEADEIIIIKD